MHNKYIEWCQYKSMYLQDVFQLHYTGKYLLSYSWFISIAFQNYIAEVLPIVPFTRHRASPSQHNPRLAWPAASHRYEINDDTEMCLLGSGKYNLSGGFLRSRTMKKSTGQLKCPSGFGSLSIRSHCRWSCQQREGSKGHRLQFTPLPSALQIDLSSTVVTEECDRRALRKR